MPTRLMVPAMMPDAGMVNRFPPSKNSSVGVALLVVARNIARANWLSPLAEKQPAPITNPACREFAAFSPSTIADVAVLLDDIPINVDMLPLLLLQLAPMVVVYPPELAFRYPIFTPNVAELEHAYPSVIARSPDALLKAPNNSDSSPLAT